MGKVLIGLVIVFFLFGCSQKPLTIAGGEDSNGVPAGLNNQFQYNNDGNFGGSIGLDYNESTSQTNFSTVVVGIPNFTVTSSTKVDNLNADFVDGFTFNQDLRTIASVIFRDLNINGNLVLKTAANRFVKLGVAVTNLGGYDLNFPNSQGAAGTFLQNNGSGQMSWASGAAAGASSSIPVMDSNNQWGGIQRFDENILFGNGVAQTGLTLTSPNGSEFCVLMSNLGVLTVIAGAC